MKSLSIFQVKTTTLEPLFLSLKPWESLSQYNLNAFDKNLGRDKQIHEMAGLNVVTFSTNFYKSSHVIAKRILDICGAIVGLILCGIASLFFSPMIRKDGGPAIFHKLVSEKMVVTLPFINSARCESMTEAIKEQFDGSKYHARWYV